MSLKGRKLTSVSNRSSVAPASGVYNSGKPDSSSFSLSEAKYSQKPREAATRRIENPTEMAFEYSFAPLGITRFL
jgi:hypothetical protein